MDSPWQKIEEAKIGDISSESEDFSEHKTPPMNNTNEFEVKRRVSEQTNFILSTSVSNLILKLEI